MSALFFLSQRLGLGRRSPATEYVYHLGALVSPGDTVIDIGANLGYYTRTLARLTGPAGRVYAVEPVEPIRRVLRRNVGSYSNVEILPYALGASSREVSMANDTAREQGYFGTGQNFVNERGEAASDEFPAQMRRGSELFAPLTRLDFIKCDIEGYELVVMREMRPLLERFRPRVLIETGGANRPRIIELFTELGYEGFTLDRSSAPAPPATEDRRNRPPGRGKGSTKEGSAGAAPAQRKARRDRLRETPATRRPAAEQAPERLLKTEHEQTTAQMRIDIITVVPELVSSPLNESILKRAQEKGLVEIVVHNLHDYAHDKRKTTDDYPFGGEAGMVMKCEPVFELVEKLCAERRYDEIIYTSPDGVRYDQHEANRLSMLENIIILCGHYKGIDHRIREHLITREISIGDYVLTGGELAACVIADSVVRLIPGALGDEASALTDCFQDDLLAPPVYTRPAEFRGWRVPDVLLSGNFAEIARWQEEQSLARTRALRPDLLDED